MKHFVFTLALALSLWAGKLMAQQPPSSTDERLRATAERLAHKYIILDGHVDLPYRLRVKNFKFVREFIGIPIETRDGDFDYVRAKRGGLSARAIA